MQVKIGSAPITWGVCEIDGWGHQLDYRRVLDEHVQAGYAGTELGPWGYLPQNVDLLRAELTRRDLAMTTAFVPLKLRDGDRFTEAEAEVRDIAKLLSALGAETILLADAGDPGRYAVAGKPEETRLHGLKDEEWVGYADRATRLARVCRDEYGLTTCFHPHGGSYIENPHEIDRLMEATDPEDIRLCLDTGHVTFGGGDAAAIAQKYDGRIGYVHLKDIQLERLDACIESGQDYAEAAKRGVFVALGAGSVDVPAILGALETSGYAGWITVEQDRTVEDTTDTLAAASASRAYLRRLGY